MSPSCGRRTKCCDKDTKLCACNNFVGVRKNGKGMNLKKEIRFYQIEHKKNNNLTKCMCVDI